MEKVTLLREQESEPLLSGNRIENLSFFHQSLSDSMRQKLNSVSYDPEKKTITAVFDKNGFSLTVENNACCLQGRVSPENIQALTDLAAGKKCRSLCVQASAENAQTVWLKAQEAGVPVSNVQPTQETLTTLRNKAENLKPLEDFFKKSTRLTVHSGSLPDKKTSAAQRFLKDLIKRPGKLALAFEAVQGFYDKHKTALNLAGMGISLAFGGPVGLTLFSQIDKARRAYEETNKRKAEEKEKLEKIARFAGKNIKRFPKANICRPYLRFAGHLAVRVAATVAVTATAGFAVGAMTSGIITTGKAVYDTHVLQDLILRAVGKKPKEDVPLNKRVHKSLQTALGVEIQQEKVDTVLNKILPSARLKKKQNNGH